MKTLNGKAALEILEKGLCRREGAWKEGRKRMGRKRGGESERERERLRP
jgi:hypothetical protein